MFYLGTAENCRTSDIGSYPFTNAVARMAKTYDAVTRLAHYLAIPSVISRFLPALCCYLLSADRLRRRGGNDTPPSPPTNVGGGYTLKVSGGTLNGGAGTNGLIVLVTLRDSGGDGPGAAGWTVTVT